MERRAPSVDKFVTKLEGMCFEGRCQEHGHRNLARSHTHLSLDMTHGASTKIKVVSVQVGCRHECKA